MNIYVGNLSWQMTDEDLRNLFEQHGTVASAKIVKDKVSGRSKGFGFVEMEDDGEAQQAITNLYDSEVMGRKIIDTDAQYKALEAESLLRTFEALGLSTSVPGSTRAEWERAAVLV